MKSIFDIDPIQVQQALNSAKPISSSAQLAVENYRNWLQSNALTASAYLQSYISLKKLSNDPGLESLLSKLDTLVTKEQLTVAVAYESITTELPGQFLYAGVEAEQVLLDLYKHNAKDIIKAIAMDNVLKPWQNNVTIGKLISWAKAAAYDYNRSGEANRITIANDAIKVSLIPVLNIGMLPDNATLVSIDNQLFIKSSGGAMQYAADPNIFRSGNETVAKLLHILQFLKSDSDNANVLVLKDEILSKVDSGLSIKSLKFDLLAGINDLVIINDRPMSIDKAKALISYQKSNAITAFLTVDGISEAIAIVNTILTILESVRGTLISNTYAKKFITEEGLVLYLVSVGTSYTVLGVMNGSVVWSKNYESLYALLGDNMLITSNALSNAITAEYSEELVQESNLAAIRKQMLAKLTEERKSYEDLLRKIETSLNDLSESLDPNPEKEKALKELETKVKNNLTTVNAEIAKLQ